MIRLSPRSGGIAIARGLAGCGATVLINGRKADKVADAIDRLNTAVPFVTIGAALRVDGGVVRSIV